MMFWRIALLGLGFLASTAVSAEEIALANLQCAPLPGGGSTGKADVTCPPETSGKVTLEQCSCPAGFLLVNINPTAAIPLAPVIER